VPNRLDIGPTRRFVTRRSDGLAPFFFSSRRRHTRSYGDWSSDVCSSDLAAVLLDLSESMEFRFTLARTAAARFLDRMRPDDRIRSEERRVGKECKSRRRTDGWQKKGERYKQDAELHAHRQLLAPE